MHWYAVVEIDANGVVLREIEKFTEWNKAGAFVRQYRAEHPDKNITLIESREIIVR